MVGQLVTKLTTSLMLLTGKEEKQLSLLDHGSTQDVIDMDDNERLRLIIELINNRLEPKKVFANTFVLGEVFKSRVTEGDTRLFFWESFHEKFIQNNLERKIAIRTDLGALEQYRLPIRMRGGEIQKACKNPEYMNFDTFFCVAYLLIFEKETAKECFGMELLKREYYIFHVKMNGMLLAARLYWDGDEWNFRTSGFDYLNPWGGGILFLYFPATSEK
ncbi:MAG: hypothetical protein H6791_02555 [Candidatus Nomurabacteria bacterium]|nr:MAG: hypothetical protein H6791_02555 [Candidatus Nomurabacteria bacterium]